MTYGPPYWEPGAFEQVNGFPRYPKREMGRRHRWIDQVRTERDLDAVVVGGATGPLETSVQFFSNWPSQLQSYVIFRDEPILLVRLWNHVPDAERISVVGDVRYGGATPRDQADDVVALLRGCRRVGMIGVVPHGDYDVLRAGSPEAAFVDLNRDYQQFRLAKTEDEMTFVRIASAMGDAAIDALANQLRPGINETDVPRIVEDVYLGHQGTNLIHFSLTTQMDQPDICVPHQYHPDRVVEAGDVFVTEISTTFWGYSGQILRTFTVGSEPNERYRTLHELAVQAYEDIVGVLKAGATVGEVLDAAEIISRQGFDIWDDLVHGFGGAYLPPIIRTRENGGATHPDDFAYPDGTLLVVQPNVIDGPAGVQVGNVLQLTAGGVDVIQKYPTELIVCGRH
jgi:Xaa-Pro aminopeptidase